ncbi:TlpA family protein disulfide reductase [Arachidicoccus sp.]|uniref:TlpA family protein disulfide reductase n=1 Tax=Arachidicoccus sp. TaxID=1872624 RepID=UPI003D1CA11A
MLLFRLVKINILILFFTLISNVGTAQKKNEAETILYKGNYNLMLNIQNLTNKIGKFKIGDSVIINKAEDKNNITVGGILKENPRMFMIRFYPDTNNLSKKELLNKPKVEQFIFLLTSGSTKIIADDRVGKNWRIESPNSLQVIFRNYFDVLYRLESYRLNKTDNFEKYRDSIAKNFLIPQFNKNKNNFIGVIISPVLVGYLHKEEDCHFLDSVYNCLGEGIKTLPIIKRRLDNIKKGCSYVGRKAQSFTLKDIQGGNISLTDFKGHYLLIDFWASWCSPCRAQNQALKQIYQKYSKLGFNILSVSTDDRKKSWIDAVQKDKLSWPQVSLLGVSKTYTDKFRDDYYFDMIPSNFLISPEGVIIANDIIPENLDKKLAAIFKKR